MKTNLTEEEIMAQLSMPADENSFNTFFNVLTEKYHRTVYYFVLRMGADDDLAKDLVQETFLKALTLFKEAKINKVAKVNFSSWLCSIARNKFIDHIRAVSQREKMHVAYGGKNPSYQPSHEDALLQKEFKQCMINIIQSLPESQKEILLLKVFGNVTHENVADATGLSSGTSKKYLSRAKANLKRKFYCLGFDNANFATVS